MDRARKLPTRAPTQSLRRAARWLPLASVGWGALAVWGFFSGDPWWQSSLTVLVGLTQAYIAGQASGQLRERQLWRAVYGDVDADGFRYAGTPLRMTRDR